MLAQNNIETFEKDGFTFSLSKQDENNTKLKITRKKTVNSDCFYVLFNSNSINLKEDKAHFPCIIELVTDANNSQSQIRWSQNYEPLSPSNIRLLVLSIEKLLHNLLLNEEDRRLLIDREYSKQRLEPFPEAYEYLFNFLNAFRGKHELQNFKCIILGYINQFRFEFSDNLRDTHAYILGLIFWMSAHNEGLGNFSSGPFIDSITGEVIYPGVGLLGSERSWVQKGMNITNETIEVTASPALKKWLQEKFLGIGRQIILGNIDVSLNLLLRTTYTAKEIKNTLKIFGSYFEVIRFNLRESPTITQIQILPNEIKKININEAIEALELYELRLKSNPSATLNGFNENQQYLIMACTGEIVQKIDFGKDFLNNLKAEYKKQISTIAPCPECMRNGVALPQKVPSFIKGTLSQQNKIKFFSKTTENASLGSYENLKLNSFK